MNNIITANNISLSYNQNETIINKASFTIENGSFTFITGASGSGKSTLLKSLYGALRLDSGTLLIGGTELNKISSKKLKLPLIINGFDKDLSKQQVHKVLNHVKLNHQSNKYPLELSGGEQQRVAMARALAHNPIMILADEPTGNLDDYSAELIWHLLEGANQQLKTTIVVVTHHIPNTLKVRYNHLHIEYGEIYEIN